METDFKKETPMTHSQEAYLNHNNAIRKVSMLYSDQKIDSKKILKLILSTITCCKTDTLAFNNRNNKYGSLLEEALHKIDSEEPFSKTSIKDIETLINYITGDYLFIYDLTIDDADNVLVINPEICVQNIYSILRLFKRICNKELPAHYTMKQLCIYQPLICDGEKVEMEQGVFKTHNYTILQEFIFTFVCNIVNRCVNYKAISPCTIIQIFLTILLHCYYDTYEFIYDNLLEKDIFFETADKLGKASSQKISIKPIYFDKIIEQFKNEKFINKCNSFTPEDKLEQIERLKNSWPNNT